MELSYNSRPPALFFLIFFKIPPTQAKPEKQKQQILAEIILCANPQANSFTDCSNVKSIKRRVTATKWDVMTSSPQQITDDLTDCSEELPCLLMT